MSATSPERPPLDPTQRESATSPERPISYYGQPIVKAPVWKKEIPLYFFTGGTAGGAALLTFGARLSGNDVLARRATLVNAAAISVSPVLLIKDLGRPAKFLNMLRVFKPTSPMSVGTWVVSGSGTASGVAAGCELLDVLPQTRLAADALGAALAPFLSTYTAALLAQSVVPVWHDARRHLPFLFAASSAAAAGGVTAAVTPAPFAAPARRLALAGAVGELLAEKAMEHRLGSLAAEPYQRGKAATFSRLAKKCTLAGAAVTALAGRRRAGAVVGGALLAAGSLFQRFAVVEAGRISAGDPKYTTLPQRERADEHGRRVQSR